MNSRDVRGRASRPLRLRLAEAVHRLRLDNLAYRIWRYNPAGLIRWYEHRRFDRTFGVDTRGYSDPRYEPTPVHVFRQMLGGLRVHYPDFVFVDLGSGKGKALLLASGYPFREIVGVELWEDLHRIAVENIRKYRSDTQMCRDITSMCMDAARFPIPEEPAIFYLFNPFPESVLDKVLNNIERSLVEHPRPLFLIFYAPVRRGTPWDRHRVFSRAQRLECLEDEGRYSIYASQEGVAVRSRPSG